MLSGGQAAGGHNVIMGVFDMVRKMNPLSRVFGFLMGPHGIFTNNYREITEDYMQLYRNTGGFDMICKFLTRYFRIFPLFDSHLFSIMLLIFDNIKGSGRHKIETPD